jgi:predicted GIY-YIG superfamily endonuclease
MAQMLLFPDPRPLVERLGLEFFRCAPELPGVYLMRGRAQEILYVGKAKNLRKRLASYRVANPDRMPRRHLRMLRAVDQIDLEPCADEAAALARESVLLRTLRPKFNRAGTWPGPARFLGCRLEGERLALAIAQELEPGWVRLGPLGAVAVPVRAMLARLTWCAVFPERGVAGLPEGWFRGQLESPCLIQAGADSKPSLAEAADLLAGLFAGQVAGFAEWVRRRTGAWTHSFDLALREADLEALDLFFVRKARRSSPESVS